MQSFAARQLAKYGWKEGEGLGRNRDGIKRAITVSRKADTRGVGSDASQWSSNWWDHLYNKASSKTTTDAGASLGADSPADAGSSSSSRSSSGADSPADSKQRDTLSEYQGMFVRQASAAAAAASAGTGAAGVARRQAVDRTKLVRDGGVHLGATGLTDAELFAACEGRTARKGARAEQRGKLARTTGDGMPRPEVVASIEAALARTIDSPPAEAPKKRKRDGGAGKKDKDSGKNDKSERKSKKDKSKKDKKRKTRPS
ncbi:hypothetical protein H4R18_005853 [Coemansia javaensis]|uniref:G-patch domain-containing protein n=1 Tax=Coemansia javaensis TaxID=2761396 RepID=A0A9W8H6H6_9FUNG|nr:hypothetical protein H4R18_005853 [Coemansia javaensis]